MVGKGSANHNDRKFHAKNTDSSRTHLNITYCNEDIKEVYHQLFDEALENYNAKQKRVDRVIPDYYKKISSGKQEKPFHELIIQIGNRDDTAAESQEGELAKQILDEYMKHFQERNPNLRVFSAHLHLDEATPHLHIDFIPFTTGSKRGLETRVSLKKALEGQGFKGGTRGDTEWNQWVSGEKEQLAAIMLEHGLEWEKKGTHEEHLSVLDYKKQERAKEVAQLNAEIEQKQAETAEVEEALHKVREKQAKVTEIEAIKPKQIPLSKQVLLSKKEFDALTSGAEQFVVQKKQEGRLQRLLEEAKKTIAELKQTIADLRKEIASLKQELSGYTSIKGKLDRAKVEAENQNLKQENQTLRDTLAAYGILIPHHQRSKGKEL
jgi:uncharacterized small protein (DUF1192 family)